MKKIVIALGGNAILKRGEKPTISTQLKNTRKALASLFSIIKENRIIITHGNGPAVGYLLLQNELARSKVPVMPLDVLDAETEGQIGYLIQQNLQNLFRKYNIKRNIITILTQVLVSENDKEFKNPTKFVGPFYNKSEAKKLSHKFTIKEDVGRGYRRVVASPKPLKIIEVKAISKMLDNNMIVIAAGGGGIPVVKKNKNLRGVEAVIDKDLASACLAHSIKADILIMITDIDRVYINYKKKGQKSLKKVSLKEVRKYYEEGQFPRGSMGPKIEAAINFLSKKGSKVIITDISNIKKAIKGDAGTIVVR
ncbi:MAG: carbamate kinase [Nanoarchaeota archaeon]|nr:carbamate kinase [Nanoarchaeota archaeon]